MLEKSLTGGQVVRVVETLETRGTRPVGIPYQTVPPAAHKMLLQAWPDTAGGPSLIRDMHHLDWHLASLLIQLAWHCTHLLHSITRSGSSARAARGGTEEAETDSCLGVWVAYAGWLGHGCLGITPDQCQRALSSCWSSPFSMAGHSSLPWHSSSPKKWAQWLFGHGEFPSSPDGFLELDPLVSTTLLMVRFWLFPSDITGTSLIWRAALSTQRAVSLALTSVFAPTGRPPPLGQSMPSTGTASSSGTASLTGAAHGHTLQPQWQSGCRSHWQTYHS